MIREIIAVAFDNVRVAAVILVIGGVRWVRGLGRRGGLGQYRFVPWFVIVRNSITVLLSIRESLSLARLWTQVFTSMVGGVWG